MTRRWAHFGIRCLLLAVAILPYENSAAHRREDSTDKILANVERLHDVTSASTVRKRFVTGRIGEKLSSPKVTSNTSSNISRSGRRKHRDKNKWKDIQHEVRDMKKSILPVLAGNMSYMQLDFKNMDRNVYNVIGEMRFVKNELAYIKHQAHVIWENVTDSRRDHKRISTVLWRILGNVTLVLSNIERTTRTINDFHRTCLPIGQRLDSVRDSLVALGDLSYIREDVNVELGKSRQEVLGSIDRITEDVRHLKRTMVYMGQSFPDVQRHLSSGFVKTEEILNAGYRQLIDNITRVNSRLYSQTGRIAAIDRTSAQMSTLLNEMSKNYTNVRNIVVVLFDRVAEIGSTVYAGNTNTYQDSIDTRNRLNAMAMQLDAIVGSTNSLKVTIDEIKPKLRAIRRAVWKKCECSRNNRSSENGNKDNYDEDDDYDDDILSIYDENVPTASSLWQEFATTPPIWYNDHKPSQQSTTIVYPSSSYYHYPPVYPPVTINPEPFSPLAYPEPPTTSIPIWYPSGDNHQFPGQSENGWPSISSGESKPFPPHPPYPTFFPPTTTFYYPELPGQPPFNGHSTIGWPTGASGTSKAPPFPPVPTFYPVYPPIHPSLPTTQQPVWFPSSQHPSGQGGPHWPTVTPPLSGTVPSVGLPIGCGERFTGYCVCVCACDCVCPALRGVELAILVNATTRHSAAPVRIWQADCQCLCPCPCPANSVVSGMPHLPPFEPPPFLPPPALFPSGSPAAVNGGSPVPAGSHYPHPPPGQQQPTVSNEWHQKELLNEIIRGNKMLRDDLENTRRFVKTEHEITRQANSVNAQNTVENIIQNMNRHFDEATKLSRETIENVRVVQTQIKQAMGKFAQALKSMAVNIMQYHTEIDNIMRRGKQGPLQNPPEITMPRFRSDYPTEAWQTGVEDPFVHHTDGHSRLSANKTLTGPVERPSGRRMFTNVGKTPNRIFANIWKRRSGRRKSARRKRGRKGAAERAMLGQYTRGSPYNVGIASRMQTNSRRMFLPNVKGTMINPIVDPFAFHNLLQRHIGNQLMNAMQTSKPAYNTGGKKARPVRWQKRDRHHNLPSLPFFPGFPFVMAPFVTRPSLPPVGFPGSHALGKTPSFVSNSLREVVRGMGRGGGGSDGAAASSPYSMSYNDGKGNTWNVNIANRQSRSARHLKASPRLVDEKKSTV